MKDIDAAERAFRLKRLAWTLPVTLAAAPLGAFVASRMGQSLGVTVLAAVVGAFAGPLIVYLLSGVIIEGAGTFAAQLHHPSGRVPPKRDYSFIASLIMRGKLEEAAEAYEDAAERFPDDPEPLLLLARLYRDRLGKPADAEACLRRLLALPRLAPEPELVASRELVDLYTRRLDRPGRALAELDRLARKFAGSPTGDWAARSGLELKERLREAAAAELSEAEAARPRSAAADEGAPDG